MLIASSGAITINGILRANGGTNGGGGGGGSGGGIRLIADAISGNGQLRCLGGAGGNAGGLGRIRIERVSAGSSVSISPDPSVVPLASDDTALLWPPSTAPTVRILSVGGTNAPADPRASFGALGPDIALSEATSFPVVIRTENVVQASLVQVRITPRSNANFSTVNATVSEVVSTDPLVILWTADIPTTVGYSALQVKVVRP